MIAEFLIISADEGFESKAIGWLHVEASHLAAAAAATERVRRLTGELSGTGRTLDPSPGLYTFWILDVCLIANFYSVDRGLRHRLPGFSSLGRLVILP